MDELSTLRTLKRIQSKIQKKENEYPGWFNSIFESVFHVTPRTTTPELGQVAFKDHKVVAKVPSKLRNKWYGITNEDGEQITYRNVLDECLNFCLKEQISPGDRFFIVQQINNLFAVVVI
jgi:hypothetical protein